MHAHTHIVTDVRDNYKFYRLLFELHLVFLFFIIKLNGNDTSEIERLGVTSLRRKSNKTKEKQILHTFFTIKIPPKVIQFHTAFRYECTWKIPLGTAPFAS